MFGRPRVEGRQPPQLDGGRGQWQPYVPPVLVEAAAWSWRLILVAALFYLLVLLLSRLMLAVVAIFVALLAAALLHRPVNFLRRHHWPAPLATWSVLIASFVALAAVGYFVVSHISAQYPELVSQVGHISGDVQRLLNRLPGFSNAPLQNLTAELTGWLDQHRATVAGGVLTAGRVAAEVITGIIVAFFLTYFFLSGGDRIWSWLVRLFPQAVQPSVNGAGFRAWRALSGWIIGTSMIAVIHGTVIGVVLWLLGAPLVVPLAVLIFIGSFIPLIGAVLFGGLAVLVTLATVGPVPALILLAVLVLENQLEGHVFQPFIVGRAVHLHPVAIVLTLTAAGVLAGIVGAIMAIPVVAAAHSAVKYLTGVEDIDGQPLRPIDRTEPMTPPRSAPLPSYVRRAPVEAADSTDSEPAGTDATESG
jgi:predicted PurR-regulated permease PerM